MEVKVKRWGNSLALRIPKQVAQDMGVDEESCVDLSVQEGVLTVTPATRHTLKELLAGITEENIHAEVETGPCVGQEVL